jgi:hypothetical protein
MRAIFSDQMHAIDGDGIFLAKTSKTSLEQSTSVGFKLVESKQAERDERVNISRRSLLASFIGSAISSSLAFARVQSSPAGRPLVGAIRWDAWYAPGSTVTTAVQKSLAPEKYRWRLPFFAETHKGTDPVLPAISQLEMDLEIRQASFAGLDYWAFLAYGEGDPMSSALSKYLESSNSNKIKFCLFSELNRWGTATNPAPLIAEHLALMKRKEYVRVSDERPLYYLGFITQKSIKERFGGADGLRRQIGKFREQCLAATGGNPYIVLAGTFSEIDEWASLGGDAIGAYAISDPRGAGSFASLAQLVEQRWHQMEKHGLPVVPTVMAGWDRRPRIEHPVPWETGQKPGAGMESYFEAPAPEELANHLRRAVQYTESQSKDRKAPAVLIYAWNENDEGGWLLPTFPCDTRRLEAAHVALGAGHQTSNPGCIVHP